MIPNQYDLIAIVDAINGCLPETADTSNFKIIIKVKKEELKKIDEDFRIRNNVEDEPKEEIDEVRVNYKGIEFVYEEETQEEFE